MGVVHRAWDRTLEREVALKELPHAAMNDEEMVTRFRQEARALARLSHPGVVQVYDLIPDPPRYWMAMELVDGVDLATALDERGPLEVDEAITLARRIAEALAAAHAEGVIHRDVKSQNVLLTPDGHPKLVDFGIAKMTSAIAATRVGDVIGSPAYMSPEQSSGRAIDARTDVYSLGVVLFEMLTGRLPFEGDLMTVIAARQSRPAPPLGEVADRDLPTGLGTLVARMLERDPERRPADMATLAAELATAPRTRKRA